MGCKRPAAKAHVDNHGGGHDYPLRCYVIYLQMDSRRRIRQHCIRSVLMQGA